MCERCVKLIVVKILFYNFRKLLATCNCVYNCVNLHLRNHCVKCVRFYVLL